MYSNGYDYGNDMKQFNPSYKITYEARNNKQMSNLASTVIN